MPLMTRQEIIDQYGFDPGGESNTSIYMKTDRSGERFSREEQEPITLDIQDEKTTGLREGTRGTNDQPTEQRETKETPSAAVLPMAASGAIRGFVSDPLMLAGMAVAGLEAAFTDKSFQESLYSEGGLERTQQHLQEYANNLPAELSPEEKKAAIRKYQASPEFFSFHTDQMGTAYGSGMKMAAAVNGMFGIAKTPEQETWQDDAAQILGSIIIPSPAIISKAAAKLAMATGKATPKFADVAAKAIDSVVLPGTSAGHYTPGVLAASGAVGLGINEVARGVMDDPTVTGGDAFTGRHTEGGFLDPNSMDHSPRPVEVAGSLAALAAAAAGLSRAFRGRVDPNLNPIDSGALGFEDQVNRNVELMGMETPAQSQPGLAARISAMINEDAEVERLARDAGRRAEETAREAGVAPHVTADVTEREVQTALGMRTSRPARDAMIENLYGGETPDGYRLSISLRDIEQVAQQAPDQASVDRYRYGMVARNTADTRLAGLHEAQASVTKAQDALDRAIRNRYSHTKQRELDIELQKQIDAFNAKMADAEATRPNMAGWDDTKVDQYITDMMADPVARKLHDMHVQYNTEIAQMMLRNGVISKETFESRLRTPWHSAMFETRGSRYDPKLGREVDVDPHELNVVVNKTIDPFQNLALQSAIAVDTINFNAGKWRVINAIRAADPDGFFIRESSNTGRNTVTVLDNGRERHFSFSRDSVAEALKFAPLSFGPIVQIANTGRRWFQKLTTGPWLGGIPTALNSLAYDVGAAHVTRRAGRSFGYIGMGARMLAGDSKMANQIIDSLDAFDPTAVIQVGKGAIAATWFKTINRVGEELVEAAMGKGAFAVVRGQVPDQVLRSIGGNMVQAYERSTVGLLRRAGAMQPHAMMQDTFGVKNRLERYIKEAENARRDVPAWKTTLRTVSEPYLALIDTVHNAGRYAFFAQNHAILQYKYGRNIPKPELERLIEETRRMAGDIQAKGSEGYNSVVAAIPYANISAQATRHLFHAAFAQGSKHTFDVGLRLFGMGVAGYASVKLAEEMGAQDWYWNVQNNFERVGTLLFPTPEALVHKASTGAWPEFDPAKPDQHFMKVRIAAELAPWTQTILTGLESAGLFDRGTNRGSQTPGRDIALAFSGALNVGNIPVVNLLSMVGGGPKLDFLNPMRGRPVAQDIKGPRGEGINTGSLPSGIPVIAQELVKTVMGLAGDVGIAMTDAGLQKYEATGNIFDSLLRAGEEGVQRLGTERMPSVPGLWKGESKVYTSTPIGSKIYQTDALVKELDEQYKMEFGKSQVNYPERPRVIDPEANAMLALTHGFLSKGAYKKYGEILNNTRAKIGQLEAQKGKLSPEDIQVQKRKLMMETRVHQERLVDIIEMHEKVLQTRFRPLFEKYGQKPTLEGAREVYQLTVRKQRTPAQ